MFYSNIKVLSYPLLFTSMLTLSFATDTLRRVTANPEWFATVLEASMQRIAACEDTDPAPQSSSPELQTCSFASAFEPQLCRLAEFQHHCSNFMDKIGSYIPPINLQSYISTLGQQFNAAFFSALQSIPPAEITAIRALKQSYSKFYLIGIISYGRRHLVPRSRKAAFPSNLASNFCIECPISFRRFLNENRQKISNTFDRIIKSLEESELKTICTERLYMQQMWRIEKKFNKLFMVENKKTAATASLTPSTPPLRQLPIKRDQLKGERQQKDQRGILRPARQ
ncbi:hypothetical protein [Candidatus Odyssella thessalonicensis]|uniref:hypothetical protein n=1 Tax=Candidatus Odyssella thessalonicensis TaxID=84647 RepID=UPI000225AC46|nr:hypothetical protein [Candidatus Odyssella thessalonicensis]